MTIKKITKKTRFKNILEYPEAVEILFEKGMHCIGCSASTGETIEQGALMHGLNPDELIKEINDKLNKRRKKR